MEDVGEALDMFALVISWHCFLLSPEQRGVALAGRSAPEAVEVLLGYLQEAPFLVRVGTGPYL